MFVVFDKIKGKKKISFTGFYQGPTPPFFSKWDIVLSCFEWPRVATERKKLKSYCQNESLRKMIFLEFLVYLTKEEAVEEVLFY